MKVLFLGMFALSASLYAQDIATQQAIQASQQATQIAIQANQQAMQAAAQATADAQRANQQAMDNAQNNYYGPVLPLTRLPKISVKSGQVAAGTLVRITSPTHYATIYYTTNGWTPTQASKVYSGPIQIQRTTMVQAIAVAPNMHPSFVSSATLTVPGSSPAPITAVSTDGVLRAGTRLHLVTAAGLDSKTAQVGDRLALQLNQDIVIGDKVMIPKGTAVEAVVTHADPPGRGHEPGDIVFEVRVLTVNGIVIPLKGGETMQGAFNYKQAVGLLMIPFVGPATLLARGEQATIPAGLTLAATVQADTPLTVSTAAAGGVR